MPHAISTPDFEVWMPMLKAGLTSDGRLHVVGVASDESEDLDREMVKARLHPPSVQYLNDWGKINWDHRTEPAAIIGDVTRAGFSTREAVQKKHGVLCKGVPVEVEGWIQPLSADPGNPYLQTAHRMARAGSKMGLSMQGHYLTRKEAVLADGTFGTVAVPDLVFQVALTPQPKNSNSLCMVKSLSSALEGLPVENVEGANWPVYICPQLLKSVDGGGLAATGVVAVGGTTGGDALKVQDLGGGSGRRRKKGIVTAALDGDDDEDNDDEGGESESARDMRKALADLAFSFRLLAG